MSALGFALAGIVLVLAMLSASAAAQTYEYGSGFGIAETTDSLGVSADAFPREGTWWAGTCDLADGGFAVGSDPGERFPACIDHRGGNRNEGDPAEFGPVPPLSPGAAAFCEPDPSRCETGPPGWALPPSWRMDPVAQAGAHPDASASFWLARTPIRTTAFSQIPPDGDPKNLVVRLPPGVIGNPNALTKCPAGPNLHTVPVTCPPESQVGVSTITLGGVQTYVVPVYNVEPRDGKTAEFIISAGFGQGYQSNVPVVAKARTDGDFGVDTMVIQIPQGVPLLGQTVTLWGVPWAAEHDAYRVPEGYRGFSSFSPGMPVTGLPGGTDFDGRSQEPQPYDPSWGAIRPFFSNPTECAPQAPVTEIQMDMWQRPFTQFSEIAPADALVSGCADVPFDSDIDMTPTSTAADAPTGLAVDLRVPQNNDLPFPAPPADADQAAVDQYVEDAAAHWKSLDGLATAQLDRAVVTLPAGVSVNPAGAAGLEGCSDAQIGVTNPDTNPLLFNNDDPFDGVGPVECPRGSVIGTVRATSPLLDETLSGQVVLGMPKSTDPQSGDMFRLFLVMRNRERGLLAKIHGSAVANPHTGQLTTTFDKNPRLPVDELHLEMKGGPRGLLATPQRCHAGHGWSALFTPWTAAHGGGGQPVSDNGSFATDSNCGFGFSPAFAAGMSSSQGGGDGTFSLRFSRQDGEQWFGALTAKMPAGLLASVGDVPLCTDAQANAGACPIASRIGTVDAAAGSGTPYFLEKKGDVYLTEGYKGAPYGLAVRVPVEAGPFRGRFALAPIVVRQALHVDRSTAEVTAVSDPFPRIWHGIPLRARQVTVKIDRPGFMRNPTDCSPKQIAAQITSTEGAAANVGSPFQATGCAGLDFEPKLRMRLVGRRQTVSQRHPGVRARVTQQAGEAGIEKAVVRLPKSLALDPDNAQALCEFEDGTKPDLENHCPEGSIVGRARAVSPLLSRPLTGNVYFIKNIRIDPDTGNEIRTLPMIVAALRGEIPINLRGESSTTKNGRLVNTFANVPDAPVSRFNLNIRGGRNGILAVTFRDGEEIDICRSRRQVAEADMDGHNGRRHDTDVRMGVPCRRFARLRVRGARWRGNRVRVAGRIAPMAKRNLRVTVRCGRAKTSKRVNPNRRGRWKTTLRIARRCRDARRVRVVVRYAGDRNLTQARALKRVRKR